MKDKRVILLLIGVIIVILLSMMNLYLLVAKEKIDTKQDAIMAQLTNRLSEIESAKNVETLPGEKGEPGQSIVGQKGTSGASGTIGKDGKNGKDGVNGTDGKDGDKGEPGESIDVRWNTCKIDGLNDINVLEKKRTSDDFWNTIMPTDPILASKIESCTTWTIQ